MADKQYYALTGPDTGSMTVENLIMLPVGGKLNNATVTISGEDLVVAGNYGDGNIVTNDSNTSEKSSSYKDYTVNFTNGGRLNLSAQTADSNQSTAAQSDFNDADIKITSSWDHSIPIGNTAPSGQTLEADIFTSTGGTFSIISDLCGTLTSRHTASLTGLTTTDGNPTDNATGNTIITTVVRANAFELYNNFNGTISATNARTTIHGRVNPNVNNNTIKTAAIWTDSGDMTFDGINTGTINTTAQNISLTATLDSIEEPKEEGAVSATGNEILTYGLLAGADGDANIAFQKGFDATVNTSLNNVSLTAIAKGGTNKASFDANLETYGMFANQMTISGDFTGKINTSVSDLTVTVGAPADKSTMTHTISGLYITDKLTADYLSGTITVDASQTISGGPTSWTGNVYGIYAGNEISVSGVFDSTISITNTNTEISAAIGIRTETLTAESLAADITITNNMGIAVGVQIDSWKNDLSSAFNVIESPFDIIGDIKVGDSTNYTVGILIKNAGDVNLRISSYIQASDYAVYSGYYDYTASTLAGRKYVWTSWTNGDDTLEIAAGAEINGTIQLGGGVNNIYIDSNAKVSDIGATNGAFTNIWFRLNQYGAVQETSGFTYNDLGSQEEIVGGTFSFATTTIYADLNDAAEGTTYKLFQNQNFASKGKTITLAYQGTTYNIAAGETGVKVGDLTVDCISDSSGIVSITVTDRAEGSYSNRLANTVYLDLAENGTGTFTLSNEVDRVNRANDYKDGYALVLTYDIYDQATGDLIQSGATKTVAVTGINGGSIDLGLESGQIVKNVHSELTQNNNRISTLTVSGTENPDDNSCTINWNTALAGEMTLNSGYIYELEYSIKKADSNEYSNSTVVNLNYLATTYTITGINEGDSVKVRLRLKDDSSATNYTASEWSDTLELTNAGSIDTAQQVTGLITTRPANENVALWIMEWDDMRSAYESGLQYYEVQFFIINNDQTPLTEDQINAVWDSADHDGKTVFTRRVTANNFYLSGLSQTGQGIYWRVKAVANDGAGADASSEVWSENYHFSPVGGNVTPPSASTDAPNITINSEYQYISGSPANSITVDWKGSLATAENGSGIAFYILYYKEEGESTYKTIRLAYNAENEYSTVISGLSKINQNVSYYITARDNSGNESTALKSGIFQGDVWAPEGAALTQVIPDDPNSMYVTNGTGGLDFVVTLQVTCGTDNEHSGIAPSGNYLYTLQYSKESTGGTTQWITIDSRYQSQIGDRTSYTVTAPGIDIRDLPVGEDNKCPTYWQLLVTDEAGNVETISLGPIYATMPGDVKFDASVTFDTAFDEENQTVTFIWGNASSTVYELAYYAVSISVDGTNWVEVGTTPHEPGTSQYELTIDGSQLQSDKTYYWKVQAVDTGKFSATKEGLTFTIPPYVPPPDGFEFGDETISVSYANGDWNLLNVTISWNTTSGVASGYVLQRAVIGSDMWEEFQTGTDTTFNFTVRVSDTNYQYRIAAKDGNYDDQLVISDAIYTPAADSHAPQFSSTTTSLTQNGSTVNLTWSEALDTLYSTQEAVSGFKEYMLYFSTSPDMSNRIAIYAGSSTSYSLTRETMIANGIDDGTYYWSVSAVDNVGNESTLVNGNGSFFVKFSPPDGTFTDLSSSLSVTYEYVDDPEVSGGSQVRQPLTITANFQFDPNSFAAGEVAKYEIQFSSSADFNSAYILLSDTFTGTSYTLSTENNGIAFIAAMAQGSNGYYSTINQVPDIYWRVRAVDSYGNATNYSATQTFKLFDNVTADGSGTLDRPLNDYYGPTTPTLTKVEAVAGSDGSLLNIEWDPAHDAFGIKTYILTVSNGVESLDIDIFSLLKQEDRFYNPGEVIVGVENFPADIGTYTFTLKAIDGSGKVSGTSNSLTYTNNNADPSWNDYPGRGTSSLSPYVLTSATTDNYSTSIQSTVGTEAGNVEHWFYCDGITGNGAANLTITGNINKLKLTIWTLTDGKLKKQKSVTVNAGGGGIYNYLMTAGVYYVSVESTDKKKYTKPASYTLNFTSDYFPAANTSQASPTKLNLTQNGSQATVSYSDFTGFGDPADYYYFESAQAGAVNISITTTSKVKVTLYAADRKKKIASTTLSKAGTYSNIFKKDALCQAGPIYLVVESGDKGKGKYNADYTLNLTNTLFPAANTSQTSRAQLVLTQTTPDQLTGSYSDFTGFGDPADYYYFVSDRAGSVNISITTSAKVKVTVYSAEQKKLASVTLSKAGTYTDIFKKAALCQAGSIYLVVESGDKGKGTHNAFYTLNLTNNLFQAATPNNYLDASAQTIALNAAGQGSFSGGWVGFGDSVDTYSFVAGANGAVELGITEVESKLKVTLYNSAGKTLKSKTITGSPSAKYSTADIFGKDILLNAGQTYYIAVESGDKGKGYQNSSYNILVNETYAPASRGNNDITTAMQLTAGSTQSDWVGYGEPSDFYRISLTDGGYVDLNFNYSGKVTLKMTTSESKSVSLQKTDFGYSSKQWLAAGDYFLEICASSPNSVTTWSNSYNLAYSSRA